MLSSLLSIAVLSGILSGLISYRLIRAIDHRLRNRPLRTAGRSQLPSFDRLAAFLALVTVPRRFQQHWETADVRRRLQHAAIPWEVEILAAFRWVLLLLSLICGVALGSWRRWDLLGFTLGAFIPLAGWLGPGIWLRWRIEHRQSEIDLALPDFLDRMALGLEAGLSFQTALQRTAEDFPGILGNQLRRLVRHLERGHARSEALDRLADRTPSQDLRAFTAAVKQSNRLGTSLAKTFRVQTRLLRARRRRRAQDAGRRIPILIVFPLVFFFLPSLLIIYLAPPLLHLFLGR